VLDATEDLTEKKPNLERRLAQVEANFALARSIDLLDLKIDFALRLLACLTSQRQGAPEAGLSGREFQVETVEAMFDLAVTLIERMEQIEVPNHREDTGSESALAPDVHGICS